MEQEKVALKKLSEEILKGNFKDSEAKITNLNTTSVIKLVISCCHVCNPKTTKCQNLNEEDLTVFLNKCAKRIKELSAPHLDSYLQSAFHILTYLLEKNKYSCVLNLEEFLLPAFLPSNLTQKQMNLYNNICAIIYNKTVVSFSRTKDMKFAQLVTQFSRLTHLIHQKISNRPALLKNAKDAILVLISLNADATVITDYYFSTLEYAKEENAFTNDSAIAIIKVFDLVYVNLLKTRNFQLASVCYNKTAELFKDMALEITQILENCNCLNPTNDNPKFHVVDVTKVAHSETLFVLCQLVSNVVFCVQQHYESRKEFNVKLTLVLQEDLFKFLQNATGALLKFEQKCSCNDKCEVKWNFSASLKLLYSITGLANSTFATFNDITKQYHAVILKIAEKYLETVLFVKNRHCEKWGNYWSDIGFHLYNSGVQLTNKKDEIGVFYFKKFVQFLLTHEKLNSPIVNRKCLTNALTSIAQIYFEQKKLQKCMLFTSFNLALSQEPLKNDLIRWIKVKCSDREDAAMQETTLVKILCDYKSDILCYCPGFYEEIFTKDLKIKLLTIELRYYKSWWKSKLPMMTVYKELLSKADAWTLSELFIEIWGQADLHVHADLPKLLEDTIKKVEKQFTTRNAKVDSVLAYLYLLLHKYQVKITIIKHCDDMEKTMCGIEKIEEDNREQDQNDECDVVSSYDCLKLKNYLKMMKSLETSFKMLTQVMSNTNLSRDVNKENLFSLSSKIAHEYSLHDQPVKCLRAWEFALKIGEMLDNKLFVLQAISFIVELSDVRRDLVEKLVKRGDEIVENLESMEHWQHAVTYHVCKCEAFFFCDFEKAYDAFKNARSLYEEAGAENFLLRARLDLLHHRFVTLPCSFEIEDHREFSLVKVHQAASYVIKHYSENFADSAYDMRVFFQINEALAEMHRDMRMPREIRCYGRDVLLIAQKMLLPLRTASLLFYLAYADVTSCRYDDCRVKISGISDILGLGTSQTFLAQPVTMSESEQKKFEEEVNDLMLDFKEMVLDLPKQRSVRQMSPGSPTFEVETFKLPLVLSHKDLCDCFYCASLEFQDLVLKASFLRGLLNVYEKNVEIAKDFFYGALKIYEFLKNKEHKFITIVQSNLSTDLVPDLSNKFSKIHSLTLLEHSNLFLRSGNVQDAKNINQRLVRNLEKCYLKHIHVYNEALLQSINILMMQSDLNKKSEINRLEVGACSNTTEEIKTPEGKRNQVRLPIEIPTSPFVSPKRLPRKVKFEIPQDDEESAKPKSKKQPSAVKRKKVLSSIPSSKQSSNISHDENIVPGTPPEAYTSAQSKVKLGLAEKNKLLQEKLKNSSKNKVKVPKIVINDENEGASASGTSSDGAKQVKSVRKNLMSQLEAGEDNTQELRRSRRNRR